MADGLLTARVLAEQLDVSAETVLRWARRREIPCLHLPGGAVRFREREVERWLDSKVRSGPAGGVADNCSSVPARPAPLGSEASATPHRGGA
jgi:excisionase family DNA binding protein